MKNFIIGIKLLGLYFGFQAMTSLAFIMKYAFKWPGELVEIRSEMIANFILPIVVNLVIALFLLNKTKWIANLLGKDIKEIENQNS